MGYGYLIESSTFPDELKDLLPDQIQELPNPDRQGIPTQGQRMRQTARLDNSFKLD